MLFEQNIASNVTRNQESKHIINLNIMKARPSTPKQSEQLLGTYRNLLNLKNKKSLIFTKRLKKKEEEEERRTKQSLDSPQTIEAKNIPFGSR